MHADVPQWPAEKKTMTVPLHTSHVAVCMHVCQDSYITRIELCYSHMYDSFRIHLETCRVVQRTTEELHHVVQQQSPKVYYQQNKWPCGGLLLTCLLVCKFFPARRHQHTNYLLNLKSTSTFLIFLPHECEESGYPRGLSPVYQCFIWFSMKWHRGLVK